MGWLVFIGLYYSLTIVGAVIGLFYPIYYLYFSKVTHDIRADISFKHPISLICFSLVSSFRFSLYSFLLLTVVAIALGITLPIYMITIGI